MNSSQNFAVGSLQLPASFQDTTAEVQQLRQSGALVTSLDCAWLQIVGSDAADFLHRMLTRSIRDMQVGETRHAWLLEPSGKIISQLSLVMIADNRFVAAIHKNYLTKVQAALDRYLIMEDVSLSAMNDWIGLAVEGQQLPAEIAAPTVIGTYTMARTFSGLDGFTLFGERAQIEQARLELQEQGLPQVGYIALNQVRLQNFKPSFDADMKAGANPLIYGAELGFIDNGKGCYIGQETVAMTRDRGRPPSRLVLLESNCESLDSDAVLYDNKTVGTFHTHAFDPQTGVHLAIATIKHSALEKDGNTFYDAHLRAWLVREITRYKAV